MTVRRLFKAAISLAAVLLVSPVHAGINVSETTSSFSIANDHLQVSVNKSLGVIDRLSLDGQDLLGSFHFEKPTPGGSSGNGNYGIGPYLDCYCVPTGTYTPGGIAPKFRLFNGSDSDGVAYAGLVMGETYPATGQLLEFYFFLRDGETGLHTFSRLAYYNTTKPFLRNLQEFRTLFRPNSPLWTHLLTNERHFAPLPGRVATAAQVTVQDATWYLGNTPNDSYVEQEADYFTKYMFQDTYRDHVAHGMYADGSQSADNSTFGAWLVMNTKDTYFNGPINSDLTVDGIVYNYIVSNHHGDGTPNITDGFDRTFGPFYYHFNKFPPNTPLHTLYDDAAQYASPTWNTAFYDSIAPDVPNYVPSSDRGSWSGQIRVRLPSSYAADPAYSEPIAILSASGYDFQDNTFNTSAYQYWTSLTTKPNGTLAGSIAGIRPGTYRLTVYAAGIFGQYTQDSITITSGEATHTKACWTPESAGHELWRIGTPDKSAGEFKHGYAANKTKPLAPESYRSYWPVYDFINEFPSGLRFAVGKSKEDEDFNYIHWAGFGGQANALRKEEVIGTTISDWTIEFDVDTDEIAKREKEGLATLTIQLAGAKTAAGNTDVFNASEPYANLPLTVGVNGKALEPWVIPYYQSSSCGVRSAVICYGLAHKFEFNASLLTNGTNEILLSLPAGAKDYETALLPRWLYVQYDALRLEVR